MRQIERDIGAATFSRRRAGGIGAVDRRPYDVTKMDFKPGSAAITSERHKDAFAAGNALNMEATLKSVAPEAVKEIQLDTTHKIIEIAPGVKFSAWTFGDQVPGPSCARVSATGSSSR
jgi:nitrite reductase (NO-forming)